MDKNLYNDTIDSIRISDEAVEKAIKNLTQPDAVGKVIEMKKSKRRFIKPIGAVAAALVLIIGAGVIFNLGSMPKQRTTNGFFITANAAATDDETVKITKKFTTIGTIKPTLGSWAENIKKPGVSRVTVNADFNFNCVGDNIDKITYKVKNGDNAGAIALFNNNKKIVDYGTKKKSFHGSVERIIENDGIEKRYFFYDYVTFDYERQPDSYDEARLAVFYNPESAEESTMMLNFLNRTDGIDSKLYDMNVGEVKKKANDFYQTIFKDTEIIVTVTYKDGSTESKTLRLGVDNIIIYDEYENKVTNESLRYKELYDYELTMSAKLV